MNDYQAQAWIRINTKLREIMMGHLKEKGWPEMSHSEILEELPEMWKKIDEDGCLSETGIDYRFFVQKAIEHQQVNEIISRLFGDGDVQQ